MSNIFNFNSRPKNVSPETRRFKTDRERAAEKNGIEPKADASHDYSERVTRIRVSIAKITSLMAALESATADNTDAPTGALKVVESD